VGAARARRGRGDADLGQDLVGLERGGEDADEEILHRDGALALGSGGHDLGAERGHRRGVIVFGGALREVAAERRAVPQQRAGGGSGGWGWPSGGWGGRGWRVLMRGGPARAAAGARPPMRRTPRSSRMYSRPGILPMSTRCSTCPSRSLRSGRRLWPPESTLA